MDNKRSSGFAVCFWLSAVSAPVHAFASQADEAKAEMPTPGISAVSDLAATPSLNPDFLARLPVRELQLGAVNFTKRLSAGVNLREEREELSIPDLGSSGALTSGFDAGSVAQDIHASSNRLQGQFPRKSSLRMNFLKFDNADYRLDVTQHPSRTGLRFHHLGTGLRIEAERRYINSATTVFIGVRLLEDRRLDPTIGCSMQSSSKNAFETRNFCGFRLRISL